MIKLIIGKKGSGKTKTLIDLVNTAINTTKGAVVCIEKGDKLKFDVKYQCRLIDTEEYHVDSAQSLFGFVAGILASNHDITDLFIDSALKIARDDLDLFDQFLEELKYLCDAHNVNCVLTSSIDATEASKTMLKYIG